MEKRGIMNKIFENYIKENENSISDEEREMKKDTYARARAYLNKIQRELLKAATPLENVKTMIDSLPPWVERLMTADSWEYLQDIHDLSKTNILFLVNRAFGDLEGSGEFIDVDDQELGPEMDFTNVAGAQTGIEEQMIQSADADQIAEIVVDEINAAFEDLPDNSPLKSREVALAAMEQIKNNLPAIIKGLDIG